MKQTIPQLPCEYKKCIMDFLYLEKMLTPKLIQLAYWVGLAFILITVISNFAQSQFWNGLGILILGPVVWQIISELFILFFHIHDSVADNNKLAKQFFAEKNKSSS